MGENRHQEDNMVVNRYSQFVTVGQMKYSVACTRTRSCTLCCGWFWRSNNNKKAVGGGRMIEKSVCVCVCVVCVLEDATTST